MSAHPAQFSTQLLPALIAPLAGLSGICLDPFAGLGRRLSDALAGTGLHMVGTELEAGYFTLGATAPGVIRASALHLPFRDGSIDAVVTSPTYGNGMNDDFRATDSSRRNTYVHRLRAALNDPDYSLHPDSTARHGVRRGVTGLARYKALHRAAWAECARVLKPGGVFVLNAKDVLHGNGQVFECTAFHVVALSDLGFEAVDWQRIPCPGLRHGRNHEARVECEDVVTLRRDAS